MKKQGCVFIIGIGMLACLLSACLGTVWTGASLVYDRHEVYEQLSDYQLAVTAGHLLAEGKVFQQPGCSIDIAVFDGDILIAGHVPTKELREIAITRLKQLSGYRTIYNQVAILDEPTQSLSDSWITTKIRSQIFADSSIAPKNYKIVTVDSIVYIMGEARVAEAQKVIDIASNTEGVARVVKIVHMLSERKKTKPAITPARHEAAITT